ncbi:Phosphatidylinositolceramide inositolphosphotransferase 2 [Nymphaea thermarum]|nr:Phosphatidylinositolceramide inositolphosphotransferase 2 [Nymphaea thermarum]
MAVNDGSRDDALHCSRSFQAMEKDHCGDDDRVASSGREVEISSAGTHFSGIKACSFAAPKERLRNIIERNGGNPSPLLPMNGKDARSKEELVKFMNGNSIDNSDWRPRTQVNGKILEDANQVHVDLGMNGA